MNPFALIMFESVDRSIEAQVKSTTSRMLSQLSVEVTIEARHDLQRRLRKELEDLVFGFFGTFDNVGCSLPEGIWGYDIQVRLPDDSSADGQDIRDGEADYADMWLEFLLDKETKKE